jgi:hypothetical protein
MKKTDAKMMILDIVNFKEKFKKTKKNLRHTDPEDGITYETTEVKTNMQGYIVAYRREICKGKPVGSIDGPYHVADIFEYT